ncbi:hypothetical protein BAUCODRAFT_34123 [Baudoinia panamericana UAMH 10762]|uniref:Probable aspartic-type endopeptidase OPSB n=1 Tax=Baudoinia panamericana (strain UAMH 10762) TaxID=717646 RepID=M2NCT4_BAUPA|nr:uncharacterized protein BAUCODRAFT_34123 [Baudoinia panamericana UAMH 10762]EMC96730.1 hypothetical protein BAUCODRAFT_34123 [Baudoinia panamericana UAMH 10762]
MPGQERRRPTRIKICVSTRRNRQTLRLRGNCRCQILVRSPDNSFWNGAGIRVSDCLHAIVRVGAASSLRFRRAFIRRLARSIQAAFAAAVAQKAILRTHTCNPAQTVHRHAQRFAGADVLVCYASWRIPLSQDHCYNSLSFDSGFCGSCSSPIFTVVATSPVFTNMRTFTTLAVAATALSANAITLLERRDGTALRVVEHEIERRQINNPIARDQARLRKRQSKTVTENLDNEETLYFMNVTMGTPAQSIRLQIDTGSSDLWVNVANSQFCAQRGNPCTVSGTYAPNSSSTYQYLNGQFNISYVDGTGSSGDYASDVVRFGGVTLNQQQFGIGYTSSSQEGIMGIGYPINEAVTQYNGDRPYSNVPQHLMQQGAINTNAYSLWLNDLDASQGSILFGGVNTGKYTGQLQTLPIIPEYGTYAEFVIALTAVGANGTVGSFGNNLASPALLDSGSSLMYLPDNVANAIYKSVGATYSASQGAAFVDCNLANSPGTIDLTFSSPTIRIPMNELVIVAGVQNRKEVCILGISPAGGSTPVLGDTFLRSAYVVYDITNNEISLAQTNFNSTTNNILEITNSSSIPSATAVANAITNVAVQSGSPRLGGLTSTLTSQAWAAPTAALGYEAALLAAVGAGMAYAL